MFHCLWYNLYILILHDHSNNWHSPCGSDEASSRFWGLIQTKALQICFTILSSCPCETQGSSSVLNARLTMRLPTSTFVRHTGFAGALDGLLFSSDFLLSLWLEGATEFFKHIFGLWGSDDFNGVFLTLQHCQTIFLLYNVFVSCYISVQLSIKVEWNIIILHKRFLYQPSQSTGLEFDQHVEILSTICMKLLAMGPLYYIRTSIGFHHCCCKTFTIFKNSQICLRICNQETPSLLRHLIF